jgi:hypothetical protein
VTLSRVHTVLIRKVIEAWRDPVAPCGSVGQLLQALLHKPLYPLVDKATAHANRGGNVGDRPPSASSNRIRLRLARRSRAAKERRLTVSAMTLR